LDLLNWALFSVCHVQILNYFGYIFRCTMLYLCPLFQIAKFEIAMAASCSTIPPVIPI